MRRKNYLVIVALLILVIGIGFALISSSLGITGLGNFRQNTWDIYFANLVDDSLDTKVTVPAYIEDKTTIEFNVNLNEPGSSYMFYTDIVNNGTIDAMFDSITINGLTQEASQYISVNITYNDGIAFTKYDLLRANSTDTLKIEALYKEDIEAEELPTEAGSITLTATINYVQADSNAKERNHNADVDGPVIRFINNASNGKNGWSHSLIVTTKVIDVSSISSVKYCVSTQECNPNTTTELLNNTFNYTFTNNNDNQILCVEAKDSENNTTTKCSTDTYLVDGDEPTISNVTVTPDDDTMLIQITGTDSSSGLAKYYYSKDGGLTYALSTNPNYTFTELEDGDYIVVVYIEDSAGNTSTTSSVSTTVRHKSWCEKQGITDLGECVIATEAGIANVNEAKVAIKAKTAPDFSKTAPSYIYEEKVSNALTTQEIYRNVYALAERYNFNQETGMFNISNIKYINDIENIDFTEKDYFMCENNSPHSCSELYKIHSATKDATTKIITITKQSMTGNILSYDTSEVGMYSMQDDYGDSYYYRGSVGGNILKFADNYWKIMRVNGDGSVRIIYYGNTPTTPNFPISSQYSSQHNDPTFLGFMYNSIDFSNTLQIGNEVNAHLESTDIKYYFSKSYTYDGTTKKFNLDYSDGNYVLESWNEGKNHLYNDGYIYTCRSSGKAPCYELAKLTSNSISSNSLKAQMLDYGSTSYENAVKNRENSPALSSIYNWYTNNIENNNLSSYLSDSIFCNDRSFVTGDGYSRHLNTYYGGYNRLQNQNVNPILTCSQKNDRFTVNDTQIGNGSLNKPIGLITADEVVISGGNFKSSNILYYLYINAFWWAMTPSYLQNSVPASWNFRIAKSGDLNETWSDATGTVIRPVLNLNPNNFTFTGTGTVEDPFIIE